MSLKNLSDDVNVIYQTRCPPPLPVARLVCLLPPLLFPKQGFFICRTVVACGKREVSYAGNS